jgi:hypothetical protein
MRDQGTSGLTQCEEDTQCLDYRCQNITKPCPDGKFACRGTMDNADCYDLQNDPRNCGSCGNEVSPCEPALTPVPWLGRLHRGQVCLQARD